MKIKKITNYVNSNLVNYSKFNKINVIGYTYMINHCDHND